MKNAPVVDARHSFGDADAIARLLTDAEFQDVGVETVSHDIRMPDAPMFARLNASALASMSAKGKTMSGAERDQPSDASSATACRSSPTTRSMARWCLHCRRTLRRREPESSARLTTISQQLRRHTFHRNDR